MKNSSKGQMAGGWVTRYRPTISGRLKPMRNQGLGEVHEKIDDDRCSCGVRWKLHPVDVLDVSKAKLAGAAKGLPRTQQRLALERRQREVAPNVEIARGGHWHQAGSVTA